MHIVVMWSYMSRRVLLRGWIDEWDSDAMSTGHIQHEHGWWKECVQGVSSGYIRVDDWTTIIRMQWFV